MCWLQIKRHSSIWMNEKQQAGMKRLNCLLMCLIDRETRQETTRNSYWSCVGAVTEEEIMPTPVKTFNEYQLYTRTIHKPQSRMPIQCSQCNVYLVVRTSYVLLHTISFLYAVCTKKKFYIFSFAIQYLCQRLPLDFKMLYIYNLLFDLCQYDQVSRDIIECLSARFLMFSNAE